MEKIATALSSRPHGALPSSTEAPTTTYGVINLRSGKEGETSPHKESEIIGVLLDKDNTKQKKRVC